MIAALMLLTACAAYMACTRTAGFDSPRAAAIARWPDTRIDLNSATAAELSLLPGIGPRLAERIVNHRAASGPFANVADLQRVRGIGPSIIERISPHATAHAQDTHTSPDAKD